MIWISGSIEFVRPHGAAIGIDVELVEEHSAIPQRLGLVLDDRLLPCVDLLTPFLTVFERGASDLPRVGAGAIEEASIVTNPFASATELNDGKVPGERHRD